MRVTLSSNLTLTPSQFRSQDLDYTKQSWVVCVKSSSFSSFTQLLSYFLDTAVSAVNVFIYSLRFRCFAPPPSPSRYHYFSLSLTLLAHVYRKHCFSSEAGGGDGGIINYKMFSLYKTKWLNNNYFPLASSIKLKTINTLWYSKRIK